MANELVTADLPMSPYTQNEKAWGEIATASSFLKRIQLYTGSSPAIAAGLIQPGHYGLVESKDNVLDLGVSFDCLPIAWRFKAMEFGEAVISVYNPEASEFKRIQSKAETADSGCSYGPEFLIWLPTNKMFVSYFMNSKTSRREAGKLKDNLRAATTLRVNLIKRGKQMWHGPIITICSTPLPALPGENEVLDAATKFASPKESEIEEAAPASGRAQ